MRYNTGKWYANKQALITTRGAGKSRAVYLLGISEECAISQRLLRSARAVLSCLLRGQSLQTAEGGQVVLWADHCRSGGQHASSTVGRLLFKSLTEADLHAANCRSTCLIDVRGNLRQKVCVFYKFTQNTPCNLSAYLKDVSRLGEGHIKELSPRSAAVLADLSDRRHLEENVCATRH